MQKIQNDKFVKQRSLSIRVAFGISIAAILGENSTIRETPRNVFEPGSRSFLRGRQKIATLELQTRRDELQPLRDSVPFPQTKRRDSPGAVAGGQLPEGSCRGQLPQAGPKDSSFDLSEKAIQIDYIFIEFNIIFTF